MGRPRRHSFAVKSCPEYAVWRGMLARCGNAKCPTYKNYGARGITVCQEWKDSFDAFLRDMGRRPSLDHSLDRYPDNDGNYEPGNCRWANEIQQQRNTRNNRTLTFRGETHCVTAWAELTRIPATAIYKRVEMGWSPERALTTPIRTSWRKRGPYNEKIRAALSAGQTRRWQRERLDVK